MESENRIDRRKVPGNLGKTFADGEEACIIVESSYFKPKMFPKKLIITTRRANNIQTRLYRKRCG